MTSLIPIGSEFDDLFRTFTNRAYRLETLQSYGSPDEDAAYAAFLAGVDFDLDPENDWWVTDVVRPAAAAGRSMSRVHVVREPLTDYLRYELTWAYAPNVDAGEDVRIIPLAANDPWPADLPENHDYWLLDDRLYEMVYADDERRSWLGSRLVDDPTRLAQAEAWRETALDRGIPWRDYVSARPELAVHLPVAS
ncbi:DUF6879 family protein [Amycolatopsis thailandensis]|uniref:DUF6879 family protein n=1 Tax=Amycolatopsis thailandensis TaxID=589330 RepID=UPI003647C553